MVTQEIKHPVVPFNQQYGNSQKQVFLWNGITLQVIWQRNSYDGKLTMRINDLGQRKRLINVKVVQGGQFAARNALGFMVFGVFVKNADPDEPEVWMMSQEDIEIMGRLVGTT